jgi:hypothetical protein
MVGAFSVALCLDSGTLEQSLLQTIETCITLSFLNSFAI